MHAAAAALPAARRSGPERQAARRGTHGGAPALGPRSHRSQPRWRPGAVQRAKQQPLAQGRRIRVRAGRSVARQGLAGAQLKGGELALAARVPSVRQPARAVLGKVMRSAQQHARGGAAQAQHRGGCGALCAQVAAVQHAVRQARHSHAAAPQKVLNGSAKAARKGRRSGQPALCRGGRRGVRRLHSVLLVLVPAAEKALALGPVAAAVAVAAVAVAVAADAVAVAVAAATAARLHEAHGGGSRVPVICHRDFVHQVRE